MGRWQGTEIEQGHPVNAALRVEQDCFVDGLLNVCIVAAQDQETDSTGLFWWLQHIDFEGKILPSGSCAVAGTAGKKNAIAAPARIA